MSCDAELARFKEQLENEWRIGEELGDPTPYHRKVFELVRLEVGCRSSFEMAMNVASLASQWITTRNPFCIDRAVVSCFAAGIEPPPSMQHLIAQVAHLRLHNKTLSGTPQKLANETAKQDALLFIANLIHTGENKAAACSKGAARHATIYPQLKRLKASTLDIYYSAEWRTPDSAGETRESRMFAHWNGSKSEAVRSEWARIAKDALEADDDLRGERR